MIKICEVKTKKQQSQFVDFPKKLYKDCKQYVPALRMDEMALFSPKKNVSYDECDIVFFLAYKDEQVVGRICGVVQNVYNKKHNTKNARFTRFDVINDKEVAKALFDAVENWASEKGMDLLTGPLGFNDLDFEGMLCEGFEHKANFEEPYSYPYYLDLMAQCGFEKDIDWVENKLYPPKEINPRIKRLSEAVKKRYNLSVPVVKSKAKFIKKYKDGIFHVIDEAYKNLHGVIPFNDKMKKQIIAQFNLFISKKFMIVVTDSKDQVVGFGFALPYLSDAMQKAKGKLFPFGLFHILKAVRKPKIADLGIIGVLPEYMGKGVVAIIMEFVMQKMINEKIEHCETNICLENNINILTQWDNFDHEQHRRRRCFKKSI